ncbi:hypothetical protein U27_01047 [Candidatus Vecturithrix granuli]|uniref:Uncharacterized protein n=1 Tax=Vecturithrix granuli TaxID=1499967 RepID=A0A081C994_VECG1|nr:hypothetical protein U27_01047 [Candidatus Vecturithrix granuli]
MLSARHKHLYKTVKKIDRVLLIISQRPKKLFFLFDFLLLCYVYYVRVFDQINMRVNTNLSAS